MKIRTWQQLKQTSRCLKIKRESTVYRVCYERIGDLFAMGSFTILSSVIVLYSIAKLITISEDMVAELRKLKIIM